MRWTAVASEMRPYQSDLGEKCSPQRCAQRLFKFLTRPAPFYFGRSEDQNRRFIKMVRDAYRFL